MLRGFARETEIAWAKDLNKETRRMLDGVDAGRRGFGVVSRRPTLRDCKQISVTSEVW